MSVFGCLFINPPQDGDTCHVNAEQMDLNADTAGSQSLDNTFYLANTGETQ